MNLNAAIAKLRYEIKLGAPVPRAAARFLRTVPTEHYQNVLRIVGRDPLLGPYFVGNVSPRSYTELGDINRASFEVQTDRALLYYAAILRTWMSEIEQFLSLERLIESAIDREAWDEALAHVEHADAVLGVSLWSLKIRICLIERAHGVADQKAFVEELRHAEGSTPILRLISSLMSSLAETAQSADLYYDYVARLFSPAAIQANGVFEYAAFHVAFFGPFRFKRLQSILDFERYNSIVDRYLTFLRVGQLAFSDPDLAAFAKLYRRALTLVGGSFTDPRMTWLRSAYDVSVHSHLTALDTSSVAPFDLYTRSRYEECMRSIESCVAQGARPAYFLELVVRCLARLDIKPEAFASRSNFYKRLDHLVAVLAAEHAPSHALAYLRKDIACFSSFDRAALLHTFILQHTSTITENLPGKYRRFADLSGSLANPRSIHAIGKTSRLVRTELGAALEDSPAYALQGYSHDPAVSAGLSEALRGVPPDRLAKYAATSALRANDPEGAREYFTRLMASSDAMCRFDGIEGLCIVLINTGELAEASRILCKSVLERPATSRRLPVRELCERIETTQKRLPTREMPIEIPNVYGLYSEHHGKDKEYRMGTVCDDFLRSWGRTRPSQLKKIAAIFEHSQLVFFLAYVCIPAAIDSNPAYQTQQEVEDERVAILQWLIALDPERRSQYADQIADIARRQAIRAAMQTVDKSRVSVNVAGVKSIIPAEAEETYLRFKSLPRFSKSHVDLIVKQLAHSGQLSGDARTRESLLLVIPTSERTEALERLYRLVRQRFIFSNDFGLDSYLSVGIRHSTLPGQLRACFERGRLITQKGSDGVYAANEHWLSRTEEEYAEADRNEAVQEALRKCSAGIDWLIGTLRNDLIQIKGEKHSSGLLSFELGEADLNELELKADGASSFSAVVDLLIDLLWKQTDMALTYTREVLKREFRDSIDRVLDRLRQDVRAVGPYRPAELDAAIVATRTAFHHEIESIANWFTRGDAAPTEDYDVALAVDIAEQMVNRCFATRALRIARTILVDRRAKAGTLHSLVNILFLLLDNALRHGAVVQQGVDLILIISERRGALAIATRNAISGANEIDAIRERIHGIETLIQSQFTPETVRAEGGSGLVKIAKILKVDLQSPTLPRLEVTEHRDFHAMIECDAHRVLV